MRLIVSLHDVHPSSLAAVTRQRAQLREVGVSCFSLLVVPRWHGGEEIEHDTAFLRTLAQWQREGDELVLHGWRHDCIGQREKWTDLFWTRAYTNREAEFVAIGVMDAHERLSAGRRLWETLGWDCTGFIAPAWLMSPVVPQVLRLSGFAYTTTRRSILRLEAGGRGQAYVSPSLCYSTRSRWRRTASLAWNARLFRSQQNEPILRISVHPDDLRHPEIWQQLLSLTQRAVETGRVSCTYRDAVRSLGPARGAPASELLTEPLAHQPRSRSVTAE
jgi:hypothetical protein